LYGIVEGLLGLELGLWHIRYSKARFDPCQFAGLSLVVWISV